MSGDGVAAGRADQLRRRLPLAVAVLALVAAALVAGPRDEGIPLDPASTGPDGLRGLVLTLESLDVHVDVSLDRPDDMSTAILVPVDLLGERRREELVAWVESGGRLVVSDPASPLHGLAASGGSLVDVVGATTRSPGCGGLEPVRAVTHAAWVGYDVPPDAARSCFALDDARAWLVERDLGAGRIVALGSAEPFTNRLLGEDDHAVLAAALLAPAPGDRVRIVPRPAVGEGETALLDLVDPRVWHGLAVALAAVLVAVVARGRRLGAPVAEELPPVVPADELTVSLSHLLQASGRPDAAARRLRSRARAVLARRLSLPDGLAPDQLADTAADRLRVAPELARVALGDAPVTSDPELLHLARAVREVVDVAAGRGSGGDPTGASD